MELTIKVINLHKVLVDNYDIILEIEDYGNDWHDSVRDCLHAKTLAEDIVPVIPKPFY